MSEQRVQRPRNLDRCWATMEGHEGFPTCTTRRMSGMLTCNWHTELEDEALRAAEPEFPDFVLAVRLARLLGGRVTAHDLLEPELIVPFKGGGQLEAPSSVTRAPEVSLPQGSGDAAAEAAPSTTPALELTTDRRQVIADAAELAEEHGQHGTAAGLRSMLSGGAA